MKKVIFCNDFKLECRRTGSQIKGRENEYVYDIYFCKNGKTILLDKSFTTKKAAQKYISETVKLANSLYYKQFKARREAFLKAREQ